MELFINGEPEFSPRRKGGIMKKEVRCCECGLVKTLEFPDEFEGHSITSYDSIKSYVSFLERIKNDYSYGHFCWAKGEEAWFCPECERKGVWIA